MRNVKLFVEIVTTGVRDGISVPACATPRGGGASREGDAARADQGSTAASPRVRYPRGGKPCQGERKRLAVRVPRRWCFAPLPRTLSPVERCQGPGRPPRPPHARGGARRGRQAAKLDEGRRVSPPCASRRDLLCREPKLPPGPSGQRQRAAGAPRSLRRPFGGYAYAPFIPPPAVRG